MENLIAQISKKIAGIEGCKLASLTYLTKTTKELARFTVRLGTSYHELVLKSITELEILQRENADKWTALQKQAAEEILTSLRNTVTAHTNGTQNDAYTKKGQYIPIGNGLNVNTTDNTIQLFGVLHAKCVLRPGEYKHVNHKPLTVAKNEIRKMLPISNFREFALDLTQFTDEGCKVKISGETLEIEPAGLV